MAITTVNPTKGAPHTNRMDSRPAPFTGEGREHAILEDSVEGRRISQARDLAALLLVSPSSEMVKQAWQTATAISNLPESGNGETASLLRSALSDLVEAAVLAEEKLDLASKPLEESVFLDEKPKQTTQMKGRVGIVRAGSNALCLNPQDVQSLTAEHEND
jgi:hypothetical protein